MKDKFISLLAETNRPGIDGLIAWLTDKSDFFTAPASRSFHGAEEGGLLIHSLAVYDCLLKVNQAFNVKADPESVAIVALLHDLCKANFYSISQRNVKNEETGKWEKQPYYTINDSLPLGHGEKSIILLQAFIRPKIDEIMAIRWHMGLTDTDFATRQAMNKAMDSYPLVLALHMADMAVSHFDKK